MPKQPQAPPSFEFSGGALALDFVNTLGDRPRATAEKLRTYADLLHWAAQAGVVDALEAKRLGRMATHDAARAGGALRRALALRETLYRVFSAMAAGAEPSAADVATFNADLAAAHKFLRLSRRDHGFVWSWSPPESRLDQLVWPVVGSAAELLTSGEVPLVRECAGDHCSWLFVDRSRTRRRRWCDMKICGNRAKAKRHYDRRRPAGG